jgi:hypothetical protein
MAKLLRGDADLEERLLATTHDRDILTSTALNTHLTSTAMG